MAVNILRRGSTGEDVERWQHFLVGRGHLRGEADGDFGPRTEDATKAFQRAQGLGSDGIVGPQTLSAANPEAIRILGDWEQQNIKMVTLPQLRGTPVYGRKSNGRTRFHHAAEEQLKAMWTAWGQADLLHRVHTYEGSYAPRFARVSRTVLSNHAFGSAFDINAPWSRLGAVPAACGREGSVRELVAIANEHGFFWGGHLRNRPDGMHFEGAELS